ncbi:hypothetical protein YC2023_096648 [Brassica napus]
MSAPIYRNRSVSSEGLRPDYHLILEDRRHHLLSHGEEGMKVRTEKNHKKSASSSNKLFGGPIKSASLTNFFTLFTKSQREILSSTAIHLPPPSSTSLSAALAHRSRLFLRLFARRFRCFSRELTVRFSLIYDRSRTFVFFLVVSLIVTTRWIRLL